MGYLGLLFLLAASSAPQLSDTDEGAVAAPGHWTLEGGAPARTGASDTAPVAAPLERAWSVRLEGEIEGEPLVWGERVLVVERLGDGRFVHVLDLRTGDELARPFEVASELPCAPSLWGPRVALRVSPRAVELLDWGGDELVSTLRLEGRVSCSEPLLFAGELYVVVDDVLYRYPAGEATPQWRARGTWRGRLALRGDSIFGVAYDSLGQAFFTELERSSGRRRGSAFVGRNGPDAPREAEVGQASVLGRNILFQTLDAFDSKRRKPLFIQLQRPLPSESPRGEVRLQLGPFAALPCSWLEGWVGYLDDPQRGLLLGLNPDARGRGLQVLADAGLHDEFLDGPVQVSRARHVGYVGGRAVDLETGTILWDAGVESSARPIPALESVLFVEGPRELVCVREAERERVSFRASARAWERPGRVVLRSGRVLSGGMELEAAAARVTIGGTAHELTDVLLVERLDGSLLYAAGPNALLRGLEILTDFEYARGFARLAELGATKAELEPWAQRLRVRGIDAEPPEAGERAEPELLRAQEQVLERLPAAIFDSRAQALPDEVPLELRLALLTRTLDLDPQNPRAARAIRALLPMRIAALRMDPRQWIEFARAAQTTPVTLVDPPRGRLDGASWSERALQRARKKWRDDVFGFESESLLIVTPLARPGAIARCLSTGELVCAALDEVFGGRSGSSREKLVLYLYETREAYVQASRGRDQHGTLERSAGHYDTRAGLSHIFWPPDDPDLDQLLRTYAHELTHHWLGAFGPARGSELLADLSGYWIVEGFASLVEEFVFDTSRGRWESFNERAAHLDGMHHTPANQAWPWEDFFGASQLTLDKAEVSGQLELDSTWLLGRRRPLDGRLLYYQQAAATCQYLYHARDGRYRDEMLEYLADFYDGRNRKLRQYFGLSPEQLGKRVREYADAVIAGERP